MSDHNPFAHLDGLWMPNPERRPGPPEHTDSGIASLDEAPRELAPADEEQVALRLLARTRPDPVKLEASSQTDGSGNLGLLVQDVAQGMELTLGWLLVSDDTHTFGSPYSAGTDWVGLYRSGAGSSDFETQLDGGPFTAGGPIIPLLFEYTATSARVLRGPCALVLRIVGDAGVASKRITVTGGAHLSRREGIS